MQDLADDFPVMKDRTLGIIGYGSIGRQLAAIGRAFGMKIYAFGRSDATDAVMFQGKDGLLEMLSKSDVVVSTIPADQPYLRHDRGTGTCRHEASRHPRERLAGRYHKRGRTV